MNPFAKIYVVFVTVQSDKQCSFFLKLTYLVLKEENKKKQEIFSSKLHSLYPHSQRLRSFFLCGNDIGMTFDIGSEFSLVGGPVLVLSSMYG